MNQHVPTPRHGIPGYYALADLPQRKPLSEGTISTGWTELDKILKIYPGQFIVCTGNAGSGKSTFLFNLIINLCWKNKTRAWLYAPENELNLLQKLQLMFGDAPDGSGFGAFAHAQCFVQSSNYAHYNDEPRDIEWILGNAWASYEKDGTSIFLVDPWNELERARLKEENLTDYIGRCLMRVKMFAKETGGTMIMVAHPTKAANGRDVTLGDIEGCYTDDTEVLTKRGWLHHGQITLSDEVACFDPQTNQVLYAEPSNILRKEHDGEIFHFEGYGYDLAVTPQHRMLVKPNWSEPVGADNGRGRPVKFKKDEWAFCRAQELPASQFVIPLAGNPIAGADPETVLIGDKEYPAAAFWRLVGWYVAEGHVGPTGLTWSQAEGELAEAFTAAFAEVGIPASIGWQEPHGKGKLRTARWYIGNRFCPDLIEWFRINCGSGAARKRIPAAVFDLSPRMKNVFLTAYLEGDGSKSGDGFSAVTVSPGLRDDLQRLAVELGMATNAGEREAPLEHHQKQYWVRFGADHRREVTMRTNRNLTREQYSGAVWCLTVPTGAYFVRRNGRVAVCGNSMHWFNKCDNGLIVKHEPGSRETVVISAKVREQPFAGRPGHCIFLVDQETGMFTEQLGGGQVL